MATSLRFRLGDHPHDLFLVNHPDFIREVLVAQDRSFSKWFSVERIKEVLGDGLFVSEGEVHMRQRRLAQPFFHRERIASYADQMSALAIRLRERWQPDAVVDICSEMNWLAMMIVASTLFGANIEHEAEEIRDALSEILDQFERSILPQADRADFEAALGRLDDAVYRIIQERRATGEDHGDLLSMLLVAQDEDDGGRMSDLQVRDEAMTIFLAGHETSANAMAWSWYLLAQHPEVEAQLHAEVDAVLQGRAPRMDDVPRLPVTGRIFSEALRLYPPLWAIGRRALVDCAVGRLSDSQGFGRALVFLRHAARRALVSRAGEVRSGTLDRGGACSASEVFLLSVFGREPVVFGRGVCQHGRRALPGGAGAEMAARDYAEASRSRSSRSSHSARGMGSRCASWRAAEKRQSTGALQDLPVSERRRCHDVAQGSN